MNNLRAQTINLTTRKVLIKNFLDTSQEKDLTLPPNCNGFGRIHHFRLNSSKAWGNNPLPNLPVAKYFGTPIEQTLKAQIFQVDTCNWNCWYCFNGKPHIHNASWLSTDQLLDLYLKESFQPSVIDLSGGQPELVPEWISWMIQSLHEKDLDKKVFLWSDDSLSVDYLWTKLSKKDLYTICSAKNYARVCCIKGIDPDSFQFNTGASSMLFQKQINILKETINLGLDVYLYLIFTIANCDYLEEKIKHFFDILQSIHPLLPLRAVPLEIKIFKASPFPPTDNYLRAINNQYVVKTSWENELHRRFSEPEILGNISQNQILKR